MSSEVNSLLQSLSSSSSHSYSFSQSNSPDFIKITVSNPHKELEPTNSLVPGTNTYVTYLITTRTNIPEFCVRKRFGDVVTLFDRLAKSYRSLFIPPRPDKSVFKSQIMQKQEFVEQQMVTLEKYPRRLAAYPMIKKSDELKVYLQVQRKLPMLATMDVASRMLGGVVRLPKQLLGDSPAMAPYEVVQPTKG